MRATAFCDRADDDKGAREAWSECVSFLVGVLLDTLLMREDGFPDQ